MLQTQETQTKQLANGMLYAIDLVRRFLLFKTAKQKNKTQLLNADKTEHHL